MRYFSAADGQAFGLLLTLVTTISGCASGMLSASSVVVGETWMSPWSQEDNIDSPAVWHGPAGQHWVIATAKSTHQLLVYDARDGRLLRRAGNAGSGAGQLLRPNGITIVDDMALVVERDNHRVQAFALPDLVPAGEFGADVLRRPYGIAAAPDTTAGTYRVFITDNYMTASGEIPPDGDLGERVRSFIVTVDREAVRAEAAIVFGDTTGPGCLRQVESVGVDPLQQRLVIVEELEGALKIYGMDGRFRDLVVGGDVFRRQPEGIALHGCANGRGYWIVADQAPTENRFLLFRRDDFAYLGAFEGSVTAHTDGVALTQPHFGQFSGGAFYAVHDDGGVAAFDWARVLSDLNLDPECSE